MEENRLFRPTERLKEAAKSFAFISSSVRTKGFLGSSLGEDNAYPSVGVHAARRSGVIVDENGKMRCPPGTPNANQFTDINMSNCMVPSAETTARMAGDAARAITRLTVDGFKRGSNPSVAKPDGVSPIAHVGFHDDKGFPTQKRINVGHSVISPIDGSPRKLLDVQDSSRHLAEGGKLSDIPDEHIIDAIMMNTGTDLVTGKQKRFQVIGAGGGVNGMTRYKDGATGALIGTKYTEKPGTMYPDEPLNEVIAEILSNHFGYEPMPMRLTYGQTHHDSRTGMSWNQGHALVTELAHNRYSGEITSGSIPDGGDKTTLPSSDIVRLAMFDSVLANRDRHEGNMLFAIDESGRGATLIPIDQSVAFTPGMPKGEDELPLWIRGAQGVAAVRLDIQASNYNTTEGRKQMVSDVAKMQEQLRSIDMDEIRQQIASAMDHYGYLSGQKHGQRNDSINDALERLEALRSANPEELVNLMMRSYPDPSAPPPQTLQEMMVDL